MNRASLFNVLVAISLLLFIPLATAIESTVEESEFSLTDEQVEPTAIEYLQLMQQAYRSKNFELLYLSSLQQQIEPMQLIHGVVDGQEVSYFRYLNGAIRESLQFAGEISYFEQGSPAYTLKSRHNRHVFANIANFDYQAGLDNYDYIILGKGRIAGKPSIAIRMISKDEYRYSYVIWCDLHSFLPLRLDTINHSNVVLEQFMVVSVNVSDTINPWLVKLTETKRPQAVHIRQQNTDKSSPWKTNWLPSGFSEVKNDQHKLAMNENDPVSYILLDDGLVNVSIYISPKKLPLDEKQKIVRHGATLLYTEQRGNTEINVVGEIPVVTAQRLVKSVVLDQNDDN
ncbi:transcriptional regulator [Psychromonas sp. psych-6C06]|uniref:MucB/RseB C-terminal domain-containing protein n=1 Tax=Psychromonas sp. psych-6C06 TaxID=2058089 RepID=UPI000C322084|nr:MucB/RseB C-terminal domain-containing protein [Psychromonas sp. psych-6C06]PKF60520.1 transcriptional regulator [Psychromonas sp. psych-6C06]